MREREEEEEERRKSGENVVIEPFGQPFCG